LKERTILYFIIMMLLIAGDPNYKLNGYIGQMDGRRYDKKIAVCMVYQLLNENE
jgi:hypothetical protein